jgi:hypothetical protein
MKRIVAGLMLGALTCSCALAVEGAKFRLLSVSGTGKLILVSSIPQKTKYVLDATTAKITVDGKPAEFTALNAYSVINVRFDLKKSSKAGIDIDGVASEIRILTPENPKISSTP